MSTAALLAILAALVLIIASYAFGVVRQAEAIARRLPDPYGTLVLTLSIVLIEVVLISAVMLGPDQHATIARDSVMAVMMIILNVVVGLALLIAGTRHAAPRLNRVGMSVYLALLVVLLAIAFAFPTLIGDNGSYTTGQAALIATLTTVLYAFFLFRQMGGQRHDFQEPDSPEERPQPSPGVGPRLSQLLTKYRGELTVRTVLLVALVLPIVLLSHALAAVLDATLSRFGAPVALVGILIAAIVFLPEIVTALRAAYRNELQRVSNLCHGAAVSTVGLTIPAVLIIGLLTDQPVLLAESPTNLVFLAMTMLLTASTAFTFRVTALHGAAHVAVFVLTC